jgi:hypothetical protein
MSAPIFSILPVSKPDLPILANSVKESKLPLAINRLLFKDWPNEAAQKANYTRPNESTFNDPSVKMWKAVDNQSGEIIAHLVLTRKVTDTTAQNGDEVPNVPDGMVPEVFTTIIKTIAEINKDIEKIDCFGIIFALSIVTNKFRNHTYLRQTSLSESWNRVRTDENWFRESENRKFTSHSLF